MNRNSLSLSLSLSLLLSLLYGTTMFKSALCEYSKHYVLESVYNNNGQNVFTLSGLLNLSNLIY